MNDEENIQVLEMEDRRKDMKRKGEGVPGEGRRKKTKLPRLEGWGEEEERIHDPPPYKHHIF